MTDRVETHLDVEIVLAEKQGEKLVYILEGTKAITNNDNAGICRKNGKFLFRLFKRYSKVEEFHKKLWGCFCGKYLPPIPPKNIINQRSEVVERRTINFELFFQTIMLHESYISHDLTRDFFKLGSMTREEQKTEKMKVYYADKAKAFLCVDVAYETETKDILNDFNKEWDIRDIKNYRVWFVNDKYGEKILDLHECPIQVLENYAATSKSSSFFSSLIGKRVTKKPRDNTLRYFEDKGKTAFYIRRVIFSPDDYELDFRMPFSELYRRYYQCIYELKVGNIFADSYEEYVDLWGLITYLRCKSKADWKPYDIVPFKEISSVIPPALFKKNKKKWQKDIYDKWDEYSKKFEGGEECAYYFLKKMAKIEFYGYNLFWVENYKKQPGPKNMWLAVNCFGFKLLDGKLGKEVMSCSYDDYGFDYYQNAVILKNKTTGVNMRLTVAMVYPIYMILQEMLKIRQ